MSREQISLKENKRNEGVFQELRNEAKRQKISLSALIFQAFNFFLESKQNKDN